MSLKTLLLSSKGILLSAVGTVAVAAVAIGGTLAYLQHDDSDVNVMTLGNVAIEQIEQERDENDNLVDFTQSKPLYPAVGEVKWNDDKLNVNGHDYKMFGDYLKNALDKIVTVKNTGESDAYVRTVIAVEDPFDVALLGINMGGVGTTQSPWLVANINGEQYSVTAFTYNAALKPDESSLPSLLQVYLKSEATNEDCEKFGNNFSILALSQAIQTEGFADAASALNEGFGEITVANVQAWFAKDELQVPTVVSTEDELVAALSNGGPVLLNADIVLDDTINVTEKTNLDLNGHTLTVSQLEAKEDTTITGGTVVHGKNTYPALSVSAGTLTLNDVKVVCEEPCNIVTSGSAQAAEYAALEVWSGNCVLNNCDLVANATVKRYSNSIFAIGIHAGELTMNGGSITVTSAGSTKPQYNYEGVLFAGSASDKVVNLNDVAVNYNQTNGKFLFAWGGNTVVNTTDADGLWDSAVDARNGGTYTINYQ